MREMFGLWHLVGFYLGLTFCENYATNGCETIGRMSCCPRLSAATAMALMHYFERLHHLELNRTA
jgi:hypothetical protein